MIGQEEIKNAGFKHIFFITSDREWSTMEEEKMLYGFLLSH